MPTDEEFLDRVGMFIIGQCSQLLYYSDNLEIINEDGSPFPVVSVSGGKDKNVAAARLSAEKGIVKLFRQVSKKPRTTLLAGCFHAHSPSDANEFAKTFLAYVKRALCRLGKQCETKVGTGSGLIQSGDFRLGGYDTIAGTSNHVVHYRILCTVACLFDSDKVHPISVAIPRVTLLCTDPNCMCQDLNLTMDATDIQIVMEFSKRHKIKSPVVLTCQKGKGGLVKALVHLASGEKDKTFPYPATLDVFENNVSTLTSLVFSSWEAKYEQDAYSQSQLPLHLTGMMKDHPLRRRI